MIGVLVQIAFSLGQAHQQPPPQHHQVPPSHHQPQGYYPQQGYPQQHAGVGGFDPITFGALGGLGQGNAIDPTALLALGGGLGLGGSGSPFDPTSVLALTGGLTGGIPGVAPNNGLLGDPSLLALSGGMGGMAGPYNGGGIDPMILMAMNANGM